MIAADASWIVALRDPADVHHETATAILSTTTEKRVLLHPLTHAECLVAPARLGMLDQADAMLRAGFTVVDVDRAAPARWAALRAETGLRLPDVIVLDTALYHSAPEIVTFDAALATSAVDRGLRVRGADPRA